MADANDTMNDMFKFWQDGQDAFFNALTGFSGWFRQIHGTGFYA